MSLNEILNQEIMFEKATGTTENCGGTKYRVGKAPSHDIGHFGSNNGTLAFADENGDYWVGNPNNEAIQVLEQAGYEGCGVYVPHSNDGGHGMRQLFSK